MLSRQSRANTASAGCAPKTPQISRPNEHKIANNSTIRRHSEVGGFAPADTPCYHPNMVTFQGQTFPSYAALARRLYVSPYAAQLVARISQQTICCAIRDGRLEGHSTNTSIPYSVSIEVLAAWRTLRSYRTTWPQRWTADDLLRCVDILPQTHIRASVWRARLCQRAAILAERQARLYIRVIAAGDLPAKTAPGRPA